MQDYHFIGLLDGGFYNAKGIPTEALNQAENGALEGKRVQEMREKEKEKYPNCNSRWSQKTGALFLCSLSAKSCKYPSLEIQNLSMLMQSQ